MKTKIDVFNSENNIPVILKIIIEGLYKESVFNGFEYRSLTNSKKNKEKILAKYKEVYEVRGEDEGENMTPFLKDIIRINPKTELYSLFHSGDDILKKYLIKYFKREFSLTRGTKCHSTDVLSINKIFDYCEGECRAIFRQHEIFNKIGDFIKKHITTDLDKRTNLDFFDILLIYQDIHEIMRLYVGKTDAPGVGLPPSYDDLADKYLLNEIHTINMLNTLLARIAKSYCKSTEIDTFIKTFKVNLNELKKGEKSIYITKASGEGEDAETCPTTGQGFLEAAKEYLQNWF